jgi:hypothetical protein
MDSTTNHLQTVLGDDNVLIVKFANVNGDTNDDHSFAAHYQHYRGVIDSGIILGLRRYQFFGKLYFWLCITCLLDKLTVGAKMASKLYLWLSWSHLSIFLLWYGSSVLM